MKCKKIAMSGGFLVRPKLGNTCNNMISGVTVQLISSFVFSTQLKQVFSFGMQNFQPLAIIFGCTVLGTALFVSDLVTYFKDTFFRLAVAVLMIPGLNMVDLNDNDSPIM